MIANLPSHGLRLTSTLNADGALALELVDEPVSQPGPDEVVVRIEATPINPSDLLAMMPSADMVTARFAGTAARPHVTMHVRPEALRAHSRRIGKPQPAGLEGAGVVIAAGSNAEGLMGKKVAMLSLASGMFGQYRTLPALECTVLPDDVSTAEGAAAFVNPLTALAIVETVRLENHKALIHTAAASSLGQMLVKICREDGVPLVNIVRKDAHVTLMRGLGAAHVCNSSAATFHEDLCRAIDETGATVAFDALGGGGMAGQLIMAMEAVAASRMPAYSPYGSNVAKQVYVYGHLDASPLTLTHGGYGLLWGVSGWVMPPILERIGLERTMALRQRVMAGLKTTFASHYVRKISLADALKRDVMQAYARQATGEKYLILPNG